MLGVPYVAIGRVARLTGLGFPELPPSCRAFSCTVEWADMLNALPLLILLLVIVTPIAWFASEFQDRRWLRMVLGSAAILLCVGVAFLSGTLEMFNANAWFGAASKALVDTTIEQLEAGNQDQVLAVLKKLQAKYSPTYENRARYDELTEEAVVDMRLKGKAP